MHSPRFKVGVVCTIIPPGFSDEKKYLQEIETENEISTFLALIICKASSFKIVCSNNFYIKYMYVLRFQCLQNTRHVPPLGHYR